MNENLLTIKRIHLAFYITILGFWSSLRVDYTLYFSFNYFINYILIVQRNLESLNQNCLKH